MERARNMPGVMRWLRRRMLWLRAPLTLNCRGAPTLTRFSRTRDDGNGTMCTAGPEDLVRTVLRDYGIAILTSDTSAMRVPRSEA
jgi:hypothetical protein